MNKKAKHNTVYIDIGLKKTKVVEMKSEKFCQLTRTGFELTLKQN